MHFNPYNIFLPNIFRAALEPITSVIGRYTGGSKTSIFIGINAIAYMSHCEVKKNFPSEVENDEKKNDDYRTFQHEWTEESVRDRGVSNMQ